jgi:hypothetical protein
LAQNSSWVQHFEPQEFAQMQERSAMPQRSSFPQHAFSHGGPGPPPPLDHVQQIWSAAQQSR